MKNSNWIVLPTGLCLAIAASIVTGNLSTPRAEAQIRSPANATLQSMEQRWKTIQSEHERLAAQLEALELHSPAQTNKRSALDLVDLAVARWMDENAPALGLGEKPGLAPTGWTEAQIEATLLGILSSQSNAAERQQRWTQLIEKGQLKAVVRALEEMTAQSPADSGLQLNLAQAYSHRIFEVGQGPLKVVYAEKADAAYDRVLANDHKQWDARFGKALTLSRQPSMLGKSGEAILQFQTLISQQESGISEERFAQSYFFLGNLYNERGQRREAQEAWQRGLQRFPRDASLRAQVDTYTKEQGQ